MLFSNRPFGELFAEPTRNGLTRPKAVRGAGTKMVNMGELFANSRIANIPMDRVPLTQSESERSLLKAGDLLFARQSLVLEGAGKCSIFLGDQEPVTFESHVTRVRLNPDEADPRFYFYWLQSFSGRSAIRSIVEQGAGAAGIRGSDLQNLSVIWCPVKVQRQIADVLSVLDDKIELNRRMNETLEAMARAIFQSWFVDFDPVRAKASGESADSICQRLGLTPELLALFPDSFEDSELGEIPKGWTVGTLGDLASNPKRGIQPDKISPTTPYIALEHMPRRSIALSDWGDGDGLESNKFEFQKGEILFGKLRPYFHKVGVAPLAGVCSTDILVVAPKSEVWFGVVLGHVSSVAFVEHTNAGSTGTKMPRTSWKEMSAYRIPLPTSAIAEQFSAQVSAALERMNSAIFESKSLGEMRDTLLPKLISGELPVSEAIAEVGV